MQFSFKIQSLFKIDSNNFLILKGTSFSLNNKLFTQQIKNKISQIINAMGNASAKAQNLKQVITTFDKFSGTQNRIYLKIVQNKVLGLLKVGQRNLFYRDYNGNIKQIKPTCVLDFYVHQSTQRSGIGKEIFDRFLQDENISPARLAYDRPSQKLLGFLKKHFGLARYIPQNNNYVIFNQYFQLSKQILTSKQDNLKQKPELCSINIKELKNHPKQNFIIKKQTELSQNNPWGRKQNLLDKTKSNSNIRLFNYKERY